jgi:hypothetical protein
MNLTRVLGIFVVTSLLLISPSAHAKKKPVPANWTSTTGTVASGSPQSHGTAAVRRDSSAAVNAITNLGCPNSDLPSDVETVVAQGEVTAPAGTTAPTWNLTTSGNIVFQNNHLFNLTVHVQAYIGVGAPGCVDFASCSPTLTPLPVADVLVLAIPGTQASVSFVQDAGALALADTAVFFVTATTLHPFSLGGSLACASGSFVPLAHNLVL